MEGYEDKKLLLDQQLEAAKDYWSDSENVCKAKSLREAIYERLDCRADKYLDKPWGQHDCADEFNSFWNFGNGCET